MICCFQSRRSSPGEMRHLGVVLLVVFFMGGVSHPQAPGALADLPGPIVPANPEFRLLRGVNEFGLWTGYSPFSFVLKGTSKHRQLFLLNLQYARVLFAARPLTLKYTAEAVPVAFELQPEQRYVVNGKLLTNPAGTIYGAGASPIGLQANFGPKRIQPFTNCSLGFLYFDRQVPIVGSSQFNYTITVGFGVEVFQRASRSFSVGWKYHHLSNDYQAHLNPGIDSGIFYLGFSVFHAKHL
jgi:hypothetical protein